MLQAVLEGNSSRSAGAAGSACSAAAATDAAAADLEGSEAAIAAAIWDAGLGPFMSYKLGDGPLAPLPGGPRGPAGSTREGDGNPGTGGEPHSGSGGSGGGAAAGSSTPSVQPSDASGGAGTARPSSSGGSGGPGREVASSWEEPSGRQRDGGSGAGRRGQHPGGSPACSGLALDGRAPSPLAPKCLPRVQLPTSPPAALAGRSQQVVQVRVGEARPTGGGHVGWVSALASYPAQLLRALGSTSSVEFVIARSASMGGNTVSVCRCMPCCTS